jgi:hypothetical protein
VVTVAAIVVIVGVVVIASIVEINAQSSPYRQTVNRSFGALATPLVNASTQTGRDLATTMKQAAGTSSSRDGLQQKLDRAVADTTSQSRDATNLVPPAAVGSLGQQLVAVFAERAAAAATVRSTVDGLLEMTPLPVAGAPAPSSPSKAPALTAAQAVTLLTNAGAQIRKADTDYASVRRALARATGPVILPRSSWVTGPPASAPLAATQLAAAPPALAASPALAVVHQLLISAVGLSPPAVPGASTGGVSTVGDNCPNPSTRPASPPATVLPPTSRISAQVTVTNCGNLDENGIVVSTSVQSVPGAPVQGTHPSTASSAPTTPSSVRRTISLTPGSSTSLAMGPLSVVNGHLYVVTTTVVVPAGQKDPTGTTQAFLVQVSP